MGALLLSMAMLSLTRRTASLCLSCLTVSPSSFPTALATRQCDVGGVVYAVYSTVHVLYCPYCTECTLYTCTQLYYCTVQYYCTVLYCTVQFYYCCTLLSVTLVSSTPGRHCFDWLVSHVTSRPRPHQSCIEAYLDCYFL